MVGSYFEVSSACTPCSVTLNSVFLNKNNLPAEEGIFFLVIDNGGTVATTTIHKGPPTLILP